MKQTFRASKCGKAWADRIAGDKKTQPARILLLDADDERVVAAAQILGEETAIHPVILGSDRILNGFTDSIDAPSAGDFRGQKGLSFAASLLLNGRVDAVIAGSSSPSADVIQTGIKEVGRTDTGVVSSYFLMIIENRLEAYADCAVIPEPTSEQLAQIAVDTADNFKLLTGINPRMAFLSFSTLGSAKHHSIDRIKRAVELAKQSRPSYAIDGELQFDAAYAAAVAQKKAPSSKVAGNANVYIFPSLEAGNIAYKVAERIGGASAIGPILQGLTKPWLDLSRGCSTNDIVDLALIAQSIVYTNKRDVYEPQSSQNLQD